MSEKKSLEQKFLYKFTEEIIRSTRIIIDLKNKELMDIARSKKVIEVEKLKKRFSNYGEKVEKKPEIKVQNIIISQSPTKLEKAEESFKPPIPPKPITPIKPITEERPIERKIESPREISPQIKQIERHEPPKIANIPIPPKQPTLLPGEINFGKISFLVKDPLITYIESPGANKNIIIKKAGITTKTQITLSKEEIREIIISFSEKARIPTIEGMLNARISNLEISAVLSETASNSFIIKKNLITERDNQESQLRRPMMQIPVRTANPMQKPMMPPINRPFGGIPSR